MTRQQYQARIRKLEREAQKALSEAGARAYRAEITKVRASYLKRESKS